MKREYECASEGIMYRKGLAQATRHPVCRRLRMVNVKTCKHRILLLGTHESFSKGWVCPECKKQINMSDLKGRAVFFAAILVKKEKQQ